MKKEIKNWTKTISIPMEIAVSIIIFSLVGYYVGKKSLGENGAIVGLILGTITGFFLAIKYLINLFRS